MEERGRALVLRIVPYNDSGSIVRCLTDEYGMRSYFYRTAKAKSTRYAIITGTFIQYQTIQRSSKMSTISEHRFDVSMPPEQLPIKHTPVWLFTIELLNRALPENFHIANLKRKIEQYYVYLLHSAVSNHPIIPLLLVNATLGIQDPAQIKIYSDVMRSNLKQFDITVQPNTVDQDEVQFKTLLQSFKDHFEIAVIESLEIL